MESIFNSFVDLAKSFNKVYPLEAIWFTKPIQTATERTVRIKKDHLLRIEDKEIVNVTIECPATHKVIECKGTIGDSVLILELVNRETNELLTLNVK